MAENETANAPLAPPPPPPPPAPPPPVPATPLDELKPLAALATIGSERIFADGLILLDPNQSSFSLAWGSLTINATIVLNDKDVTSTIKFDGLNINLLLNAVNDADFFVKFKNIINYGGNPTHVSIFMRPQAAIGNPARLVSYVISSSASRL